MHFELTTGVRVTLERRVDVDGALPPGVEGGIRVWCRGCRRQLFPGTECQCHPGVTVMIMTAGWLTDERRCQVEALLLAPVWDRFDIDDLQDPSCSVAQLLDG